MLTPIYVYHKMKSLSTAQLALLAKCDMRKVVDRDTVTSEIKLLGKSGGKSGEPLS